MTTLTPSLVANPGQKQHRDLERKLSFRQTFLSRVSKEGAFYVPFIGDGDIASALYTDRKIFGGDLEGKRVAAAKRRLKGAEIVQANCDMFPFAGRGITWALADFDSFAYPYAGFRAFWRSTHLYRANPFVCFFTDGERQGIMRASAFVAPDGKHRKVKAAERSALYKAYFEQLVIPWFHQAVAPWKVVHIDHYYRAMQLYWGAVLEAPDGYQPGAKVPVSQLQGTKGHKFDQTKKAAYLELLRNGHQRGMAAEQIGVSRAIVWEHTTKDPAFAAAVTQAEMDSCEAVVRALYETALAGNVTAQQVWLYNRDREHWADRRNIASVVSGPDGRPISIAALLFAAQAGGGGEMVTLADAGTPALADGQTNGNSHSQPS